LARRRIVEAHRAVWNLSYGVSRGTACPLGPSSRGRRIPSLRLTIASSGFPCCSDEMHQQASPRTADYVLYASYSEAGVRPSRAPPQAQAHAGGAWAASRLLREYRRALERGEQGIPDGVRQTVEALTIGPAAKLPAPDLVTIDGFHSDILTALAGRVDPTLFRIMCGRLAAGALAAASSSQRWVR
jgi:hypothetical protein